MSSANLKVEMRNFKSADAKNDVANRFLTNGGADFLEEKRLVVARKFLQPDRMIHSDDEQTVAQADRLRVAGNVGAYNLRPEIEDLRLLETLFETQSLHYAGNEFVKGGGGLRPARVGGHAGPPFAQDLGSQRGRHLDCC